MKNMKLSKESYASARVCSLHFEETCFYAAIDSGRRKLLHQAIPTIFPTLPLSCQPTPVNILLQLLNY